MQLVLAIMIVCTVCPSVSGALAQSVNMSMRGEYVAKFAMANESEAKRTEDGKKVALSHLNGFFEAKEMLVPGDNGGMRPI